MSYTAKQIDNMSIEEIESLAEMLNEEELLKWTSNGYDGASYVEIVKSR
jgi:succinate dehydrogenase flavin-adding protein (antitoxin of CptAB toxin-antitoxin module)